MNYVAAMLAVALLAVALLAVALLEVSLLKQPVSRSSPSRVLRGKVTWAVTFEGNGQLAESDYAGVVAGLLAVSKEEKGTANLSSLLEAFDYVVGNSGGVWYSGMLAYSEKVRSAQESMGSFPERAGAIWNQEVFSSEDVAAMLEGGKTSWYDAIEEMKRTSAGLLGHIELGNITAMQSWVKGKIWLMAVSLPTGSRSERIRVNSTLTYAINNWQEVSMGNTYIPAVISVKLDKNTADSPAPFPICGEQCKQLKMVHYGGCEESSGDINAVQAFSRPGRFLFTGVLTSSSAYLMSNDIGNVSDGESVSQLAWVQPGTTHPFLSGEEAVVYHHSSEDVCKSFALGDGAYTDNTGIANAVAAGADVVTAFLNGDSLSTWLEALSDPSHGYGVFKESLQESMQNSQERHTIYNVTENRISVTFVIVRVTTAQSLWFDVSEGKQVQLNLIVIEGFLDATWYWSVYPGVKSFGWLVQSLVDSVAASENREVAKWVLSEFFGQKDFKNQLDVPLYP